RQAAEKMMPRRGYRVNRHRRPDAPDDQARRMHLRPAVAALVALLFAAAAGAEEKIRITYANNSLTFLAAFIAKDRGFYARNGLAAELIQARPAVNIAALLSGDGDYVEAFGSAIRPAEKGAPIRAFSNSIKAPFFSLVVQPT